eukprot:579751-Pyramimonas_sp.AAC.1
MAQGPHSVHINSQVPSEDGAPKLDHEYRLASETIGSDPFDSYFETQGTRGGSGTVFWCST